MSLRHIVYEFIKRGKIGTLKKRNFYSFGINSIIEKPYLQLSGLKGVSIGNEVTILKNCRLAVYGEISNESIIIGDRTYIGFGFTALSTSNSTIKIGKDVLFASNVLISSENHGIDPELGIPYMSQELTSKDVSVDDGCWIGEKVIILPGVHIGKKSIIGAGSIVTKSIPAYSIAVGNPARIVKKYDFTKKSWEKV